MPKVSIVLPVYNGEDCLEETLSSILNQTLVDFELICVDDGSTDSAPDILAKAASQDSRINVIHQENGGPGTARNNGLDHATGDYVCMLDADDIYSLSMLETMYSRAVDTQADIVVCGSTNFDDKTGEELESQWAVKENQLPKADTFSPEEIKDFVFTAFMGWPWDKLYKRSFIEENGLRYPPLQNSEDLYLVFLATAKASVISVVNEELIRHRTNRSGSVSSTRAKAPLDFYKSICLLKDALKADPELYERYSWCFFNWAFEYLIWNIQTMTDQGARKIQLRALANGDYPEIELNKHAGAYFALNPAHYDEYLELLCEAYGLEMPKPKLGFLQRLGGFLIRAGESGLLKTIGKFFGKRLFHNKPATEPKPTIVRSSGYLVSSKEDLIDYLAILNGEK